MLLEDYLDFPSPEDIRIKGHWIGIQNAIKYYLSGYSPEEILEELPNTRTTLSRMAEQRTITSHR